MSSRYDYTYTLGTNREDFLDELAKTLNDADKQFSKSNLTLKLVGDEKELQKQLEKLKTLNPKIMSTVTLDISTDGLKQDVDLMTKVITGKIKEKDIGKTLRTQLEDGLKNSDIKTDLQDLLDDAFGSGTKITKQNVEKLVSSIKSELESLTSSLPSMEGSIESYDRLVKLAEKYSKLSNIFSSPGQIQRAGLTKELDSERKTFESEFKTVSDAFFDNAGKYINSNIKDLKDSATKRYEDAVFSIYNNLKAVVTSMGNPLVAAFAVDNAKNKVGQLSKQIEELNRLKNSLIQEAQKSVDQITARAASDKTVSTASVDKLITDYKVLETFLGNDIEKFRSKLSDDQKLYLDSTIDSAKSSIQRYEESVKAITDPFGWELKSLQNEKNAITGFLSDMGAKVQEQVQEQVQLEKAKNTIDVEINPVITDPAAFVAKAEAQLANQIVKIAVEPVINSVAEFQELLRQQLPNEFIDVKFNLENGSTLSLGGIDQYLDKADNLKALGEALDVLANGLESLNIALTSPKFSELKDFTISNEALENLPKFADGLEKLGQKLQTFSSPATGVLSSINQILSQSKSLEYLYNLANSPNSSKQSNIVGNGLMNAFDKSAINTIQHPAGGTDEVAALAKEYQWLTTQAKAYFTLASKYAKGTISSEDSLKLTQLERAMTGAIQRMAQFQETDQSLVTAQTDLQNALNKCGTAVESGLVNNLTKALTQIDTAENKALGFSNSIQEVKDKVVEIQRVFSTDGLIPTSEIEKAEGTLKKALSDVKQLKQDISEAKKAQENEIKNSYKNIFGNYGNTALGKADKGVVTDEVEIQKLVNEYNYLNKALSEYIQLMGKEAANPDKSADRTSKINALTTAYTAFIARADAGVDTESRLVKASDDLSNALTNASKALSADLSKKLQSYIDKLGKAEDGTTKYSDTIKKLQEVWQKLATFQNTQATDVNQIKAIFDEYQVGADVYSEALAKIKAAQKEVLESQKAQLSLDIEKWLRDNTKAAAKYETELRQLQKDIQKVSTAEELDAIRTKVLKFEESAEKAKLTGSAFADTLKRKFKELGTYLMSFASFYQVVNVLKQGVSIVHDYDDAFTEMRKVTTASTSSLKEFQKESFNLANQVGTTAQELQQSTADWLRLGESFEEAKKSAQDANVLLNVSEFEDINSATESLTAMSQAYQELDKIEIIDKLNNIGNKFNIATNDLAESLQRSAATLKVTGNTIDEAIALTVAGNSILQDPLSVGAGLKTISLRIQGTEAAKQELEELGEETENVIHTTAKLQETIKECTAVASNGFKGVDILDDNGNFLSTYEILSRIAAVYQEIVETDKQAGTNRASMLVEQLAGKNRANIAASILQSPELLKQVYEEVKESSGSAQKELNSYLDSISGKLTTLKNTWQELWFNFIDSSTVKGVVDVLNDLAKILEKITTFAKPMGTISALIGGMISVFGHGKYYKLYNASFYKVA